MKFFKKFSVAVTFRLIILLGLLFAFSKILGKQELFFNQVILGGIIIILFFELLRYTNRTNREVSRFVDSLLHQDHAANYSGLEFMGNSFAQLGDSFTQIAENFKTVRAEKEGQYQYLLKILENVPVGIITLQGNHVEQINQHALQLLDIPRVNNLSHLISSHPNLANAIGERSNRKSQLIEVTTNDTLKKIFLRQSEIIILGKVYNVVSIQDIGSELAQQEVVAWNQLISILTHEMMNSVTPITSLSETMELLLDDGNGNKKNVGELTDENIRDLHTSLRMIRNRGEGILTFIDGYRKVSKLPTPKYSTFKLIEFFLSLENLFKSDFSERNIFFSIDNTNSGIELRADYILIEQVFINLITNSIYALEGKEDSKIRININEYEDSLLIELFDNGKGISSAKQAKVFIPFFTTRENGTGIGLSLSKQIMMAHGGEIRVKSEENKFTSFFLKFRK